MKICNKCQTAKTKSNYHKASRNKDGLQHTCKKCKKKLDAERYRSSPKKKESNQSRKKIIADKINNYKKSKGCKYCSENEPVALDFHHITPNKENCISNLKYSSWTVIEKEINKCDVVCANCHRKIHAKILKEV